MARRARRRLRAGGAAASLQGNADSHSAASRAAADVKVQSQSSRRSVAQQSQEGGSRAAQEAEVQSQSSRQEAAHPQHQRQERGMAVAHRVNQSSSGAQDAELQSQSSRRDAPPVNQSSSRCRAAEPEHPDQSSPGARDGEIRSQSSRRDTARQRQNEGSIAAPEADVQSQSSRHGSDRVSGVQIALVRASWASRPRQPVWLCGLSCRWALLHQQAVSPPSGSADASSVGRALDAAPCPQTDGARSGAQQTCADRCGSSGFSNSKHRSYFSSKYAVAHVVTASWARSLGEERFRRAAGLDHSIVARQETAQCCAVWSGRQQDPRMVLLGNIQICRSCKERRPRCFALSQGMTT